jgi:hypothetical protein
MSVAPLDVGAGAAGLAVRAFVCTLHRPLQPTPLAMWMMALARSSTSAALTVATQAKIIRHTVRPTAGPPSTRTHTRPGGPAPSSELAPSAPRCKRGLVLSRPDILTVATPTLERARRGSRPPRGHAS